MRVRDVVTSLTFRYIALYAVILSLSVFMVLGGLYAFFSYRYFGDLSESVLDELQKA